MMGPMDSRERGFGASALPAAAGGPGSAVLVAEMPQLSAQNGKKRCLIDRRLVACTLRTTLPQQWDLVGIWE